MEVSTKESMKPAAGTCVVDGGNLLHKMAWVLPCTYSDILDQCLKYTLRNYDYRGRIIIAFDGYEDECSVKCQEHSNRPLKGLMAPEVHIHDISIEVASQKNEFFRNTANNMQLIKTLSRKFQEVQINVRKSKGGCRHSHRKDCKELCRRPFRRKHRCIDDSSPSLERRQQRHLLL